VGAMGKKHKQEITGSLISFPFQSLISYFLLFFTLSLLVLFALTPILSLAKLGLIRWVLHLLLGTKTPYIHSIPYTRSLSISLPVFTGLFFGYRKINKTNPVPLKRELSKAFLCIFTLWLLEVATHILEITVKKLNISTFFPNFLLTILISIGSISFPFLIWLIVFHPTFLD
jgi:hypothetical protein